MGRTLTREILQRLENSLRADRHDDPALRALCFLISTLAREVVGPTKRQWRSDPFFYEAFKIAVVQLLDALDPPGPIRAGKLTFKGHDAATNPSIQRYAASFESTEARAVYTVDILLSQLRTAPRWGAEQRREQEKLAMRYPSLVDAVYGMADAERDLAVKPQSPAEMEQANVQVFYWGRPEQEES